MGDLDATRHEHAGTGAPGSQAAGPAGATPPAAPSAARQDQFLEVIDRDEARRRFHRHLRLTPLGTERVPLLQTLDRVLAGDVISQVDVPGFDRANVDGFAVQAADTSGATEDAPRSLWLNAEVLAPGTLPSAVVQPGTATTLATGAVVPRGADAMLMVEYSDLAEEQGRVVLRVTRAVSPGEQIAFAGTDVARGEMVLRAGTLLTSREVGVLAAIGEDAVDVFRRPRIAIVSTGNEIRPPGQPIRTGEVYDSNAAILSAAVRELGAEPVLLGIVNDDEARLAECVARGLEYDLLLLSGGTSKGAGDLSYRVVSRLTDPGIVAHGVALKPGKPICLAVTQGKPVVILPGFPTSAIFTFHEFVAPVIRALGGRPPPRTEQVAATLPMRVNSERGRTEYLLVGLVRNPDGYAAYPMGKGSGSVTTFSGADGFITIEQHTEQLETGSRVQVQLIGQGLAPADLVVIGSHCVGVDYLLSVLQQRGVSARQMNVGSQGGLAAAQRGQCDIAGMHLLDPVSGEYNRPFLSPDLELVSGYRRLQGIVHRPGDPRFAGRSPADVLAAASEPECRMVNRNAGSGTRFLIDRLLGGVQPAGYAVQTKSHNAVAAAIAQGRADWGVAIDTVARQYGLEFIPLQDEHYDFVIPRSRADRAAVAAFRALLTEPAIQSHLRELGFRL